MLTEHHHTHPEGDAMTFLIADNNPNNEWGKHVIEVVVKQWRCEKTFVTRVGGNCHGFTIMETAIDNIYESLLSEDGSPPELILTDHTGRELLCCDDEGLEEEWLKKMVVSCRIIDFEPPTINEVRARNGAKPLPDGDRPWVALGS
jgi:hypothetical protein